MSTATDKNRIAVVVKQYFDAWNEPDVAKREAMLAACWGEGAVYVDPTVELAGAAALNVHIAKVQAARPGAHLEFMSGIDVHHNVVRFLWRLVRADGTAGDTSIDFGEIGHDGRLAKIVGFFGAVPAL